MSRPVPKIDPGTTGISFVDILFALVVGQVLDPVRLWAMSSHDHPLTTAEAMHLAVALVITLASWVGYHGSSNRPRFRLVFFNVELAKFVLDIAMVVVYFVTAAYALRVPVSIRPETVLVCIAFLLYLLWDLAGALQKRVKNGPYEMAWNKAYDDMGRPDVHEPWRPTDWNRILATVVCFALSVVLLLVSWIVFPRQQHLTWKGSVVVDSIIIVLLVGYRFWKDHLPTPEPAKVVAVRPDNATGPGDSPSARSAR